MKTRKCITLLFCTAMFLSGFAQKVRVQNGTLYIPAGMHKIGDYQFQGKTNFRKVVFPSGVVSVGEGAFMMCSALTSITLPSSVKEMGDGVFAYCTSLNQATLPSTAPKVPDLTFVGCSSLSSSNTPQYSQGDRRKCFLRLHSVEIYCTS